MEGGGIMREVVEYGWECPIFRRCPVNGQVGGLGKSPSSIGGGSCGSDKVVSAVDIV